MTQRVTVVGAGIIGLSCAVRLAEAGFEVAVLARELAQETTSALAGALWLPTGGESDPRWATWALDSLQELTRVGRTDSAAGVRLLPGVLAHRRRPHGVPWPFRPATLDLDGAADGALADLDQPRRLPEVTPVDDPSPGFSFGFATAPVPVVDMPVHLRHLQRRLDAAGGCLTRLPLAALPERGVVVNATGLAARMLTPDPAVRPLTGQTVVVSDPGLDAWWYDGDDAGQVRTYAIPHGGRVVLGGGAVLDQWAKDADPKVGERILQRVRAVLPQLAGATVLGHRVGMRPWRPTVRLETEHRPTREDPAHTVVHCYGHGGNGVSLAWGCAGEVVARVQAAVDGQRRDDEPAARLRA